MSTIDPTTTYTSVRAEILDQKKCQFQMFGAAMTFSSAVFAFVISFSPVSIVLVSPIIMNVFSLLMIMDKAISIQRMVGYLQLMESEKLTTSWMWEYHLNKFREHPAIAGQPEPHRKHRYTRNISLMLISLNSVSIVLYIWKTDWNAKTIVDYIMHISMAFFYLLGIFVAFYRSSQLVKGKYTANAIKNRWLKVIEDKK